MFLTLFFSTQPKEAIMLPQHRRADQVKEVDSGTQMLGFVLIYFIVILAIGVLTFAYSKSWLITGQAVGVTIFLLTFALFIWGAVTTIKTGSTRNAAHDNDCDGNH